MAGRAAVLAWEETKQANPCVPSDHTGNYEYGGLSYDLVAAPSGASFESCSKLVTLVLKQDADCGAPVVCAFPSLRLDALHGACSVCTAMFIFPRAPTLDTPPLFSRMPSGIGSLFEQ